MTDYVDAPGLQGEVALIRDSYGIPHIRAGSAADAWFAMGFACAQDRLFQLEYDRRRAAGRWAEVAGPAAVPGDVLARRMGITEAAHADLAVMSAPVREMFEAYARGVNAVIASGARPAELPDTVIEPWQPWHSVAAYKVRHILMGQWQHKLTEASVLARVGTEAFGLLDTRSPVGSALTVPPGGRLSRAIADAVADVERAAPHLGFLAEAEPGSNAWAVSGRRTAHGGAVLCNDSHRQLDAPNVYWQCHLDCPDFRVIGAAFPGVPGFPHFGHNGQVAWAITHASADTQDLYLEQFDETRPGWYRTENGWEQARQRTETIAVRGAEPVTTRIWATRHGPVVHGDPLAGMAIALKYTATCRPGRGFEPLLPMLAARNVRELVDAQRDWVDPVNNLVTADTTGAIAYQARGELPVRSSPAHRRLPVPGWDGACEWTGLVPFEQMPRCVDPDAGFVMTANNAIVDGDEPYITYTFSHPFRAERLRHCLTATQRHTVAGLAALQGDMTSWAAQAWGRLLADVPAFPEEDHSERTRLALAGWNGDLRGDSAEALLYGCFLRALAEALYRPLTGDETWHWLTSGQVPPADTVIRRWLANDTWELLGGPMPAGQAGKAKAKQQRVLAALPRALAAAWHQASQLAGRERRWDTTHRTRPVHPLAGQAPAPVGMGGDGDTIQVGAYSWRQGTPFDVINLSVYRQVVDLADPAAASFVIPGGASADPASPHFADQLAEWAHHRRIPMHFNWPDVEAAAKSATTLRPR
ncbi:MAG TPA: penicillin acylase family protein [Streptosporangiaceae bacterium]|nr:penicillin acylase family protein [Streptosporangiaceae bacterium]